MVKYILNCDGGGGVRGVVAAQVLAELELELQSPLHERFDLFCGSNTGALTVLAIGIDKASAKNVLEGFYSQEALKKWMVRTGTGAWSKSEGISLTKPHFNHEAKTAYLKEKISATKVTSFQKPVLVPLYNLQSRKLISVGYQSEVADQTIVCTAAELADAATATPIYFSSVKIGSNSKSSSSSASNQWFIDGSLVCSDPSLLAFAHAKHKWGEYDEIKVLSIGCGRPTRMINGVEAIQYGGIDWLQHDLLGISMDSSLASNQLAELFPTQYLRVDAPLTNLSEDFDDMSPENIEKLKKFGKELFQAHKQQILKFFEAPKVKSKEKERPKEREEEVVKKSSSKSNLKKMKEEEEKKKKEEEDAAAATAAAAAAAAKKRKEEEEALSKKKKEEEELAKKKAEEEAKKEEIRRRKEKEIIKEKG